MIGQGNMNKLFFTLSIFGFLFMHVQSSFAATLRAISAQETIVAGDTFLIEWLLDTEGQMINVIDGAITYSPQTLDVVSVSTANSAATLWTATPHVTSPGVIGFTGGIPAGINSSQVALIRTTFRAKASGDAAVSVASGSKAYLSDGAGSPIALSATPVVFSIFSASKSGYTVSSPTHPDQHVWYKDHRVVITFSTKPGEEYSYSMSTNPELIPDQTADTAGAAVVYDDLPDGIYYFKLASRVGGGMWQETKVFQVQIDATAPTILSADSNRSPEIYGNAPFASFSASDKISGIKNYAIKIGWLDWYRTATSPEKLRRPLIGNTYLKVTDNAGNATIVKLDFNSVLPTGLGYFAILIALVALFFVIRFLKRHLVFTSPNEPSV